MADIIIKGMEMPESCYSCQLRKRNGMEIICPVLGKSFSVADVNILHYRLNGCPISPAPEWVKFTTREPDAEEREMHPDWEYVLNCQLPDDGQRILVHVKYSAHENVQMDEFYYDADDCYLGSGYDLLSEVTHWMPLPEPPEVET